MGDMNDPFSKSRMRTGKGLAWSSWSIPEGMSESEALVRREKTKKNNHRRFKHLNDLEEKSRLPFEEMFLFGSHPESDILSLSQCPGCSRRYKTQWLHNYHWEQNSSGEYVCALSKAVVIPHRSSSKSDHHKHHHQDSAKVPDGIHTHAHSKPNNVSSGKIHGGIPANCNGSASKPDVLAKIDGVKSSSPSPAKSEKVPLMTKAKAKMMPPNLPAQPPVANTVVSAGTSSPRSSSASYTLSIPDTAQDESVESLLNQVESCNKNYSNGGKAVQMIATAIQRTPKPGEEEYEEMKFYSAESYDGKKNKLQHHHGNKTGTENEKQTVLAEGVASGDAATALAFKAGTPGGGVTTLQNFKIPLKSKTHDGKLGVTSPCSSPHSNSQTNSTSHNAKNKSKLSPNVSPSSSSKSSSHDSPFSPHRATGAGGSPLHPSAHSPLSTLNHHPPAGSVLSPQPATSLNSAGAGGVNESSSPSFKTPAYSADSPVKVEIKNLDSPVPPPKKKKKKKSKNEPRKILPLKDRLFDPDVHCGVINVDTGEQCTRSLTCKTHSMALRRAVVGRSQNFDQLLAEHKKARDAEKAAKIASEQPSTDLSPAGFVSPQVMSGANSPGGTKQQPSGASKGKMAKSPYGASSPSPLSSSSTANSNPRSVSSTATSSGSSPLIPAYPTQGDGSFFVPKLEGDVSKIPAGLDGVQPNRKGNDMYDNDFLSVSSGGIFKSSAGNVSIAKSSASLTCSDSMVNVTYSTGNDFVDNSMEIANEAVIDGSYQTTKCTDGSGTRMGNLGFPGHYENDEQMEVQDPLAMALEMAAASAMGNPIPDSSPGYTASVDNSSNLGYSTATQSAYQTSSPVNATSAYSNSLYQSSNNFNLNSYSASPSYSLATSSYPSVVSASYAGTDYHAATSGFNQEGASDVYHHSAGRGYQVSNFPPAGFRGFAAAPNSYPAGASPSRYPNSAAYPKTPSVYPPSAVYPPGSSVYSAPPGSGIYPGGTPMYQPAPSSLFPSEPPVFSILDDLFSENPAPSNAPPIPPDPNIPPPGGSSFLQPFLLRGAVSGSSTLSPSPLESSLNSKCDPSKRWSNAADSAHYIAGIDQPLGATNSNGSNNTDGRRRSESQISRLKKLLAVKEKTNECENNPADYLALTGSENIERGFIYIQRQKDSLLKTDEPKLESSKHSEDIENIEERSQDEFEDKSKKKQSKKKKRPLMSPFIPFEVKRLKQDESVEVKKIEVTSDRMGPKITTNSYVVEPAKSDEVENISQELRSEAIKTIQSSLLALNTCVDSAGQQNGEIVREGGNSNGKKQSIARLLSDLADLNEKNSDLFSGMKKLRMKDILRLVNLSSNLSLNGGIKDDGGPINSSSSLYQPDIDSQDEIETYIDAIPVLEVEP